MLGAGNNKVKYSRLAADEDGYIDLQVRPLFFSNSTNLTSTIFTLHCEMVQFICPHVT